MHFLDRYKGPNLLRNGKQSIFIFCSAYASSATLEVVMDILIAPTHSSFSAHMSRKGFLVHSDFDRGTLFRIRRDTPNGISVIGKGDDSDDASSLPWLL